MHKMLVRWSLQNLQYILLSMGGSKAFTKREKFIIILGLLAQMGSLPLTAIETKMKGKEEGKFDLGNDKFEVFIVYPSAHALFSFG